MSSSKRSTVDGKEETPDPREALRAYLSARGLKSTRQRDLIVDVFFGTGGHLRVDELLDQVRAIDSKVSQATVYRTMRLLKESGLALERRFGDGQARYEPSTESEEHHDHLICLDCERIIEFVDERIETLQEEVASAHGFVVERHKLELYGHCRDCRKK